MEAPRYTRRQLLAAGATLGLGGITAGTLGLSGLARAAASVRAAGSDLGAVEHVVFLMLENRSFDHLFGSYKAVRGFDDHGPSLGAFAQAWPGGASSALLPFHLDTLRHQGECTFDLTHSWAPEHDCWNDGAMDSFVSTHVSSSFEGPANGPLTMGYYKRADSPFFYALADRFTICDSYFCSVLGPTHPNRLFALSGTNDPDGVAGGPVLSTSTSFPGGKPTKFSVSWETMPERLSAAGVSWKVYNPFGSTYAPASSSALLVSDNILLYFKQYSDSSSSLYQNAFNYYGPDVKGGFTGPGTSPDDFTQDVRSGQLPAVTWIVPPVGYDSHPPAPIALCEWYVSKILSALLSNTKVWSKTVLFVTWDENDGFFDHVSPPTPPPGTPGEYLTVLPSNANGIAGPIGLGFRVPMLVVSPFSTGGYLSSQTFDHTSQLRFLETRFGVPVPNLSDWRRAVTGDLTSTLGHLGHPNLNRPQLPVTLKSTKRPPVGTECSPAQLTEINVAVKPYPIPSQQSMPTQETGTLIRI